MVVFVLVVLVLLVGVVAAVAVGWRRGLSIGMAAPTSTMGFAGVPGEDLTSESVAQLRFDRVFRGYRMDQVDAVLDRVRADLAEREAALAELAAAAGGGFPALDVPDDLSGLGHDLPGDGLNRVDEDVPDESADDPPDGLDEGLDTSLHEGPDDDSDDGPGHGRRPDWYGGGPAGRGGGR